MRAPKKTIPSNGSIPCQQVLDSLMAHLPGHVYWKDREGVYLGCNDRQAQSLGLQRGEEVIGKTDFELPWQEELAKRFWQNDREVLTSGQAKKIEEAAIVDGRSAIVWSLKVPLKGAKGEIIGVLGISVDITAQKRAEAKLIQAKEAAEASYQAKMTFLEDMRHDIRTPMAGIRGCIEAIKDCLTQPKQISAYLAALDSASEALLKLLNQVLASTEATYGALPMQQERFQLQNIIGQVLQLNQALAKQKGLSLILEHDQTIPFLIGDSRRVERIILELVTNALNYTVQGCVKIKTELSARQTQQVIIQISIEDTGIGIPLEVQPILFSPFKRLVPAHKGNPSRAGLGLSITKQYVEDLEGELYFESTPKQGSLFTCVLPLKAALLQAEDDRRDRTPVKQCPSFKHITLENGSFSEEDKWPNGRPRPRILLVEDDSIVLRVMKHLFTKLHCEVETASSVHSALLKVQQKNYALILLDLGLPDGSGSDVAISVRQNDKCPNQATPMIVVSAHIDRQNKKLCQLAGINAVLVKPLSEDHVRQILAIFVLS